MYRKRTYHGPLHVNEYNQISVIEELQNTVKTLQNTVGTLQNTVTNLQEDIKEIKETLGYLPNGCVYEQAKLDFKYRAQGNI